MDAQVNGETMGAVLTSQTLWTSSTLEQRSTVQPVQCLQKRNFTLHKIQEHYNILYGNIDTE